MDLKPNSEFHRSSYKAIRFSPAQCLNAVRTVQSLACLDEADHTVGFLLQLSSFCKEWQFHLPKLLRDVQASPEKCFMCQQGHRHSSAEVAAN